MELTKENIIKLLEENDKAVLRALIVINQNQTSTEQSLHLTSEANNRGFRPCHARMGTSMANFATKFGKLSDKQIQYWRAKDRAGNMRIGIYWKQLIVAAKQRVE